MLGDGWMSGYPLDCYDYQSTCTAAVLINNSEKKNQKVSIMSLCICRCTIYHILWSNSVSRGKIAKDGPQCQTFFIFSLQIWLSCPAKFQFQLSQSSEFSLSSSPSSISVGVIKFCQGATDTLQVEWQRWEQIFEQICKSASARWSAGESTVS